MFLVPTVSCSTRVESKENLFPSNSRIHRSLCRRILRTLLRYILLILMLRRIRIRIFRDSHPPGQPRLTPPIHTRVQHQVRRHRISTLFQSGRTRGRYRGICRRG